MADPTRYERGFSFSGFQASAPQTPLPGSNVDAELDNLEVTTSQLVDAMQDIRRSDGQLKNGVVTAESLSTEILSGIKPSVAWGASTNYVKGATVFTGVILYRCLVDHLSNASFSVDLIAGRWEQLADFSVIASDAQAARDVAITQAGTATTQAGIATTQAGIASSAASTATTGAGVATTQAGLATTQAGVATTGASTATTQAGVATTQAGIATAQAGIATAAANNYNQGITQPETTIASSATTNIGASNTERVVITGSVAITSFGAQPWRIRLVRFTGTPTLTHNATSLILPTAANIIAQVGDTAHFISDASGNWRCSSYERSDGTSLAPAIVGNAALRASNFPNDLDTVNLPAIRRRLRIAPDLYDWGLVGSSPAQAANNSTKIATLINDMRTVYALQEVIVPDDVFYFGSGIVVDHGLRFTGIQMSGSVLIANHSGNIIHFTGQYGTGGGASKLSLGYTGTNGNIGIFVSANAAGYSADFTKFCDLNITHYSGGTMAYGMLFDGDARRPVSGLQGLRDITVEGCYIFNVSGGNAMELRHVRAFKCMGCDFFQGGGTSTGLYVRGFNSTFVSTGVRFGFMNTGAPVFQDVVDFSVTGSRFSAVGTIASSCFDGLFTVHGALPINNATANNVRIL
jgi:hypothetical protein